MKVSLPTWISSLSGWNNGLVFYGYKDKYGLCYSRDYVYPTLTINNTNFGSRGKAVSDTTWKEASLGFIADSKIYAAAWNLTQSEGRETMRDLTGLNCFVKAVFSAAKVTGFNLSTLTVDKCGGSAGNLLGATICTFGNLITAASMPACGLTLADLDTDIVPV